MGVVLGPIETKFFDRKFDVKVVVSLTPKKGTPGKRFCEMDRMFSGEITAGGCLIFRLLFC